MNFLQGLGGVGAGLMTAQQLLRQQQQDEINNRLKTSQAGLADVQLKNANKTLENEAAYGEIASKEPGTQTILRADAPADEWGQQQTETIAKPTDRRGGFEAMAQEALKRGDNASYAKFVQYGDHLKKQHDEGVTDIAKMVHSGNVDPVAAARAWNGVGKDRVVEESVKWDRDTGTLSGIDATSGQRISMDKTAAQQYLIMSGTIKPDEYLESGINKRTGLNAKGRIPEGKPIVANGTVILPGEDENGNRTMTPVYTAPKQPSVVVHTGRDELTTTQKRANEEIDAARKALAGLSRDEVMRRTQSATATGRNNPDYDPQLAGRWSLANKRKYGEDPNFDAHTQQQAGSLAEELHRAKRQSDISRRLSADPAMKGKRAGKLTPQGMEVLDQSGRVVGHYN